MASLRRPLAAPAIAAALALGACGGDGEADDYVDEVNQVQVELVDEVTATVSANPPANAEQAADVAANLRDDFATTARELEAIEPPEEVAGVHDELVAAIRGLRAGIGEAERAFASGNPGRAARAASDLQAASADLQPELNRLVDEINAQLQE
jgi:hypothetical protein